MTVLPKTMHDSHLIMCRAWMEMHLKDLDAERREQLALSICGALDGAWYRGNIAADEPGE